MFISGACYLIMAQGGGMESVKFLNTPDSQYFNAESI